ICDGTAYPPPRNSQLCTMNRDSFSRKTGVAELEVRSDGKGLRGPLSGRMAAVSRIREAAADWALEADQIDLPVAEHEYRRHVGLAGRRVGRPATVCPRREFPQHIRLVGLPNGCD